MSIKEAKVINLLSEYFESKKYQRIYPQSEAAILAACENPFSITNFKINKKIFPLAQTNQMRLEEYLLKNPEYSGFFCTTTSYRDEKKENFIPGRHQRIFNMFEFEHKGDMWDLISEEEMLLLHLGFDPTKFVRLKYEDVCDIYGIDTIEAKDEQALYEDYGPTVLIYHFPERSQPFWNMKNEGGGIYSKVDVILYGYETIGSAQRSSDVDEMRTQFASIMGGKYAKKLFDEYGQKRVIKELNEYLSLNFFDRFGGGIGISRLVRAMELEKLI